jgi:hypothetical protein
LRDTFRLDDLIVVTQSKQIYPAAIDWSLEMARAVTLDFLFRNWCAAFGPLSNPVNVLKSFEWFM